MDREVSLSDAAGPTTGETFQGFDPVSVPSPCFVIDAAGVRRNVEILGQVQRDSGATILMALKAFSMPALFGHINPVLRGVCASGIWEARLGREEFGGEVHTFAPAFKDEEFDEVLNLSDHVVFNSFSQWKRFRERALAAASARPLRFGIRINPEHSEAEVPLYDPCAPWSRLGVPIAAFEPDELDGITGLHLHTLCEQDADALERTVAAVEQRFGEWLPRMEWLNLGGGHHISRRGYDTERLVRVVRGLQERYGVKVYLEPGEAVVIHTGILVATVLDIVHNNIDIAILDTSATAHMPDVLEMPYRPTVLAAGAPGARTPGGGLAKRFSEAGAPGEQAYTYRLGGQTCLAGDVIGDYSFDRPLQVGDRLIFDDMAHYTEVKTTMFNGVRHPALAVYDSADGTLDVVRQFGYEDFLRRHA